jgi:serine carboxypeptidase-like clade 2
VAEDNLKAVLGWFEKFPEFKEHELYLAGESYAGIYVPYLLNQIHHHNQVHVADDEFKPNLKGMMVGNGCTNWKYDTFPAFFEMSYWHSLIQPELYEKYLELGCDFSELEWDVIPTGECGTILEKFSEAVADVNIYDIFGTCYGLSQEEEATRGRGLMEVENKSKGSFTAADYTPWAFPKFKNKSGFGPETVVKETPPCVYGGPLTDYLNRGDVKQALHIPDSIQAWEMCKGDIDYSPLRVGSQWVWESLKGEYRMLKFSGDTDGAVPTTGTINWIQSLGREVYEAWRPYYTADGELGGYIEEYDGLTLGTVHGAGHMAPQFKPEATYHLIFQWLKNQKI